MYITFGRTCFNLLERSFEMILYKYLPNKRENFKPNKGLTKKFKIILYKYLRKK